MNFKVKYKSPIVWNIILFLVFSFIFLHVQIALIREISALNLRLIRVNIFQLKEIVGMLALAIYAIINMKNWSRILYFLAVTSVIGFTVFLLRENFSKMILVILGLYTAIAYYFYQLLIYELEEPCYNPNYDERNLYAPMIKEIKVIIKDEKAQLAGYLTNWNSTSCFIHLSEAVKNSLSKNLLCEIHFCDRVFISNAILTTISEGLDGIGLKFETDGTEVFSWKSFYEVTEQQGITAELIK